MSATRLWIFVFAFCGFAALVKIYISLTAAVGVWAVPVGVALIVVYCKAVRMLYNGFGGSP